MFVDALKKVLPWKQLTLGTAWIEVRRNYLRSFEGHTSSAFIAFYVGFVVSQKTDKKGCGFCGSGECDQAQATRPLSSVDEKDRARS